MRKRLWILAVAMMASALLGALCLPGIAAAAAPKYHLYVEKGSYTLTVFEKDKNGEFTKALGMMRVAVGTGDSTKEGDFTITDKSRWLKLSSGKYVQYATKLSNGLYIYSASYNSADIYDLNASSYEAIGTRAETGGSLRGTCASAKWIYENCAVGTTIKIVGGSPRSSTSKAPAALGSDRSYDPTDSAATAAGYRWVKSNKGTWFCYDKKGNLQKGWVNDKGVWYYLSASTGAMQTGWLNAGKKTYYLASNGAMATGWKHIGGSWYYFSSSGAMQTGWKSIGSKWYYMDGQGRMAANKWLKTKTTYYWVDANGVMGTGWKRVDGKWYHFAQSGSMHTGWVSLKGKWYYLNPGGDMHTGYYTDNKGRIYYLNQNGDMRTGWLYQNGWRYFDATGAMVKSDWRKVNGKWYYMDAKGLMVTGEQEIGGRTSKFDANGAWLGYK